MEPLIGIFVIGCQTFSQWEKGATNEQLSRQTYGGYRPWPLRPNISFAFAKFLFRGNLKSSEWMEPLIGIFVNGCQTFSQRGK